MPVLALSETHVQILGDQVIDFDRPGPVLRDFRVLLDFIGANGVKAAGKYNLLPIEIIPELDERLSRPLRLQLKRPQLRSHPYLQGLQLLRASGLGRIGGAGNKYSCASSSQKPANPLRHHSLPCITCRPGRITTRCPLR